MMKSLTILSLLTTCVAKDWNSFLLNYNKVYDSHSEVLKRKEVFEINKKWIQEHNDRFEQGLESFKVSMNEFGDLTDDEFRKHYLIADVGSEIKDSLDQESTFLTREASFRYLPESMNWAMLGGVTAVKDQGLCGACWAFSALGALEGQIFRRTGKLIDLSEQNLVDCSKSYGNRGCLGGMPYRALQYILEHGVEMEQSYPYLGQEGECQYNRTKVAKMRILAYLRREGEKEENLREAVAIGGPISACIWASKSFRFYSNGVYYNSECENNRKINHALLVVGYGNDNGTDYWLVKNSWGVNWGNNGYAKMARNKNDHCNIASHCLLPII